MIQNPRSIDSIVQRAGCHDLSSNAPRFHCFLSCTIATITNDRSTRPLTSIGMSIVRSCQRSCRSKIVASSNRLIGICYFIIYFLKKWQGGPKHQNLRKILRFKGGFVFTIVNFFRKGRIAAEFYICTRLAFEGFLFFSSQLIKFVSASKNWCV